MSNCENYVSEEDIRALKESEQHIEHVARSRDSSGSKALSVTDTIRGESVTNRTLDGLEELYQNALSNIGYQQMGDYATGITIDGRNQIVFYDGSWYIYRGELPHVTTGATLPEDGGIWSDTNPNGLWVDVGDASLRGELRTLVYTCDDLSVEVIPSIYTDVILKSRYNYKRAPSVYVVDGIRVIVSADGAVWEIHNPVAIYASDFCHDTDSLQKAYRIATQLNAKFYIDKTFDNLLPTTKISGGKDGVHDSVLQILDDSYLEFINDGALKLANTNSPWSNILFCGMGVDNFQIINPVIHGDRLLNTENNQDPMKGQWGYGIAVYDCSNGHIKNPKIYDCLGDGIYVGKRYGDTSDAVPTNVLIEYPFITGVRRNGISLCAGENIGILNPMINKVGSYDGVVGAWPRSGIDIEPEKASLEDGGVRLTNCYITNPCISNCYAGLWANIALAELRMNVHIQGRLVLDGITNTGLSLVRLRTHPDSCGTLKIDTVEVLSKPNQLIQWCFSADDRIRCEIDEIIDSSNTTGEFSVQTYTAASPSSISSIGNLAIHRYVSSGNRLNIWNSTDVSNLHLKGIKLPDSTARVNLWSSGGLFKSVQGEVRGSTTVTEFAYSRQLGDTITQNITTKAITTSLLNDYRAVKVQRQFSATPNQASIVNGIRIVGSDGNIKDYLSSTTRGAWVVLRNNPNPDEYTEILGMYGVWS